LAQPSILILIPAFNAGAELATVLAKVAERHPRRHILVVDDGSTTTDYGDLRAAGWRIERRPHGGKGAALRAGFERALGENYDWIITMDADGQHSPDDLPRFFEAIALGQFDLIVGNRMGDTHTMPWLRKMTNRFTSWLLRRLTGMPLHDVQSGYRAIRRLALERIPLTTSHYDTEIEQLLRSSRAGLRIGEVPITTIYNQGRSFVSKSKDTYRFWRIIARLLLEPKAKQTISSPTTATDRK
jgi:glycosyltransferase involved in cell wall biosynthesis